MTKTDFSSISAGSKLVDVRCTISDVVSDAQSASFGLISGGAVGFFMKETIAALLLSPS